MLRRAEQLEPAVPCARCAAPSMSDIWGLACCAECRAVWFASERTTGGAVDRALGVTWVQGKGATRGGLEVPPQEYAKATCDEYRRLARVWSHSAKQALRVAEAAGEGA